MKKRIKRWLVCGLALAALSAYVGNDFTLVNIEQTAVVTALGVDVCEQDDGGTNDASVNARQEEKTNSVSGSSNGKNTAVNKKSKTYDVSAQISLPKEGANGSATEQKVISAQGKTVGTALALLGKSTGWYLKMAFCTLVVLSEEVVKEDVLPILDYFVKDSKMQDAAYLTACRGKAKEVLTSLSPLDGVSAFALGRVLQYNGRAPSGVNPVTVKEFAEAAHGLGKSGHMPFLFAAKASRGVGFSQAPAVEGLLFRPERDTEIVQSPSFTQKEGAEGSGGNGGNGGNGGSSSQSSSSGEQAAGGSSSQKSPSQGGLQGSPAQEVVYDGACTLLFANGRAVALLDGKQSLIKSLLSQKTTLLPVYGEGGEEDYLIAVTKNKSKLSVSVQKGKPTVTLKLHLTAKIEDENGSSALRPADRKNYLPPEVQRRAEAQLTAWAEAAFSLSAQAESDLFGICNRLYQKTPKKAKLFLLGGWKGANLITDVRISPLR